MGIETHSIPLASETISMFKLKNSEPPIVEVSITENRGGTVHYKRGLITRSFISQAVDILGNRVTGNSKCMLIL